MGNSPVAVVARAREVIRYYQAGAVNAVFGFGAYAILVAFGLNLFVAQILAHMLGIGFNYFTYSRHVFREAGPAKIRFLLSYLVNYFISVAALFLISRVVASPYGAGFLAIVATSAINYFALKYFVFTRTAAS